MVDTEERLAKRIRTSDDPSKQSEVSAMIEDDDVWMDDGNVIVSAGDDPVRLFKCHKSILCKHSITFSEMLGIPASSSAEEQYQGLPRVHLTDSTEDVRALLKLLYDPREVPLEMHDVRIVEKLAGPLRLAKKYMMEDLYALLFKIFSRNWPTTVEDWLTKQEEISKRMSADVDANRFAFCGSEGVDFRLYHADPAPVVRLARELELNDVLPVAFYELQKWYPCNAAYEDRCQYVSVQTNVLDKNDLRVLLLGKEWLRDAVEMAFESLAKFASGALSRACEGDTNTQCKQSGIQWIESNRDFHRRQYSFPECRDPIWRFKEMEEQLRTKDNASSLMLDRVCSVCTRRLAARIVAERRALWEYLPHAFAYSSEA